MNDAEAAATLAEFRRLNLGPDLSAAMDHAIGVLRAPKVILPPLSGTARDSVAPGEWHAGRSGGSIPGGLYDGVLMNGQVA